MKKNSSTNENNPKLGLIIGAGMITAAVAGYFVIQNQLKPSYPNLKLISYNSLVKCNTIEVDPTTKKEKCKNNLYDTLQTLKIKLHNGKTYTFNAVNKSIVHTNEFYSESKDIKKMYTDIREEKVIAKLENLEDLISIPAERKRITSSHKNKTLTVFIQDKEGNKYLLKDYKHFGHHNHFGSLDFFSYTKKGHKNPSIVLQDINRNTWFNDEDNTLRKDIGNLMYNYHEKQVTKKHIDLLNEGKPKRSSRHRGFSNSR